MSNYTQYAEPLFLITVVLSISLFSRAFQNARKIRMVLIGWVLLQAIPGYLGFYTETSSLPPRFILLIGPPILMFLGMFLTKSGRSLIDNLDLKRLTQFHVVRFPVEITLHLLFLAGTLPQMLTYTGVNYDIVMGITALPIAFLSFRANGQNKFTLTLWNLLGLGLLLNIVIRGILSVPSPFQQLNMDQPNIAMTYFPYMYLPGIVAPLALFSHLAALRKLLKK